MKNKYQRMTKEEKNKLKEKFKKDSFGKVQLGRLERLNLTGLLGIIVSFAMPFVTYLVDNEINTYTYIMSALLLIMSLIFLIGSYKIKVRDLNKFAIELDNANRKKRK